MPQKVTLQNAIRPVTLLNTIFGIGIIEFPVNRLRIMFTYLYGLIHIAVYGVAVHYAFGQIKYFDITSNVRQFMCKAGLIGSTFLTAATMGIAFSKINVK